MALDENDIETRTLNLERRVNRLRSIIDEMVIFRLPRLEQNLAMLWSLPPRRVAQIAGQIDGCADQGFPGATVRILNADGERLGTGKCDSDGHYTAWANLDSDPQTVEIEATPVGTFADRFDGPATESLEVNVGGNDAPTIVIPPTEDWCCGEEDYFPGDCGCSGNNITFTLRGCGTSPCSVAGATVDIKLGGTTVFSGTTDSSGRVVYSDPQPGTYAIEWAVPGTSISGSSSTTISTSCNSQSVTVTLSASLGVSFCTDGCGVPYIIADLFVTDALGTRGINECTTCVSSGGITFAVVTSLLSSGPAPCGSPVWSVLYSFYGPPSNVCPQSGTPTLGDTSTPTTGADCSRPVAMTGSLRSLSGFCGITTYLIHE